MRQYVVLPSYLLEAVRVSVETLEQDVALKNVDVHRLDVKHHFSLLPLVESLLVVLLVLAL